MEHALYIFRVKHTIECWLRVALFMIFDDISAYFLDPGNSRDPERNHENNHAFQNQNNLLKHTLKRQNITQKKHVKVKTYVYIYTCISSPYIS